MLVLLLSVLLQDGSSLKTVAELDGVTVQVQGYVSAGVKFSDWQREGDKIRCVALWERGPDDNIRLDFCDADDVRIEGKMMPYESLAKGQKVKLTIGVRKGTKTLKIVRVLED